MALDATDKVDDAWTIETLFNKGFLDFDYYTSTELNTLSSNLSSLSSSQSHLIVVSTGLRVEVFGAADVTILSSSGTAEADHYRISNLDGLIDTIDLATGAGNDMVEIILGGKSTAKDTAINVIAAGGEDVIWVTAGGSQDTVSTIALDGGADNDRLKVSASIPAAVVMQGGAGNDSLNLDGEGADYEVFAAFGGAGIDTIMGGANVDFVYGDDTLNWSQRAAFVSALLARVAANTPTVRA